MENLRLRIDSTAYRTTFNLRKMAYIACLTAMAAILLSAACSRQAADIDVGLGQGFSLVPGQKASIIGEPLDIRFLEVVNDSRCPADVTCVWEGQTTCLVEVTYADSRNSMVLTQPGSGKSKADFNEYDI